MSVIENENIAKLVAIVKLIENENIAKLVAIVKLEDDMTKHMREFDDSLKQITFTELTRQLRREHPEIIEKVRELIIKIDGKEIGITCGK